MSLIHKSAMYKRKHANGARRQSGAALIVALILLVALSLMAVSSMNTATLDLVMAGNYQYRNRAFVAAEAGIEHGFEIAPLDSSSDFTQASTASGAGADSFAYTMTRPNNGVFEPGGIEETSMNASSGFGKITFRIASDGTSERGATARHTLELYRVVRNPESFSANAGCGSAAAANLDGTVSGC